MITGRRPHLSLNRPQSGALSNCASEKLDTSRPTISPPAPSRCAKNGSSGRIINTPIMSIIAVIIRITSSRGTRRSCQIVAPVSVSPMVHTSHGGTPASANEGAATSISAKTSSFGASERGRRHGSANHAGQRHESENVGNH